MKLFIAVVSVFLVGLVGAVDDCKTALGTCSAKPADYKEVENKCNSRYGAVAHFEDQLSAYSRLQIETSYEYLTLATAFNSYQRDRPGFQKLFRSLSDQAFENSIKLIKQNAKRGGKTTLNYLTTTFGSDTDELSAISRALELEKKLAQEAIEIHASVTKHEKQCAEPCAVKPVGLHHDPEMSQYLEEQFIENQSEGIRKLAGYSNDLYKIMVDKTGPMGLYLFDQYLEKHYKQFGS